MVVSITKPNTARSYMLMCTCDPLPLHTMLLFKQGILGLDTGIDRTVYSTAWEEYMVAVLLTWNGRSLALVHMKCVSVCLAVRATSPEVSPR